MKQPGDKGASRRRFRSERELQEATECPLATGDLCDGTVCAGPDCEHWHAVIWRDEHGNPYQADVLCTANGRTNGMGTIRAKPAKQGARQ
jgi:hypothetical protein